MNEQSAARRPLRPCLCKWQSEGQWGYDVQRWVGGRRSWKNVGTATTVNVARELAAGIPTVLIRCRGCGADILREHSPKP